MTPEQLVSGLVRRGMPLHVAQGFAGNFAVESGFNPGINEINPVVPGSRGGYGLSQWTGPRRRQLESFAAQRGVPVSDAEMQLDFLMWELDNTESSARDAIWGASDAGTAAQLVSQKFLRPGIPHLDRRVSAANKIAGSTGHVSAQQNALAAPQQQAPEQNNLALLEKFRPQANYLDPSAFMTTHRF